MENKIKKGIIFSIVYLPDHVGGAEIAVDNITKRINPNNFIFDMICLRSAKQKINKINNVNIHYVGFYINTKNIFGKIIFYIQKMLFPVMSAIKASFLNFKNKYDFAWAIMANYAGFGAFIFGSLNKVPYLLTLQEGSPVEEIIKKGKLIGPFFKKIFTSSSYIHVISKHLKSLAVSMGAKDIDIIPNGVDLEIFNPNKINFKNILQNNKINKEEGDVFVVTTSRLVKKNNISSVIQAFQFLPSNYKFLILGVGEEEFMLKGLVKKLSLDKRVFFFGNIKQEEIPSYFVVSDIFIRPSISEGLGNSFLEAMAMRLPVIASPVGGIIDFLIDRENGVFCDPLNYNDIAEKIILLSSDKELKDKITKNAELMIKQNYNWNKIAEDIERILNKI